MPLQKHDVLFYDKDMSKRALSAKDTLRQEYESTSKPAYSVMTREDFQQREEAFLAPYAMKSTTTKGRKYPEPEHFYRTAFQRDRDRITHASAFRRLEYKTQVFVYHEGDYYRTRLTHSLETAQLARTTARALCLNEDLAEAVALAHDLGHPPFGHAGEKAMDELMVQEGGFNHNIQGLRIVEVLENRYPDFPGLNLCFEVREGMAKHTPDLHYPELKNYNPLLSPTLEALIVDKCDEIAYNNHDLDDGLTSGMIHLEDLQSVPLWQETFERVREDAKTNNPRILIHETIKSIINNQILDLIQTTAKNLEAHHVLSLEDVRKTKTNLVDFSPEVKKKHKKLKEFLNLNFYQNYTVIRMTEKGKRVIRDLFEILTKIPRQLPPHIYRKIGQESVLRVVCDYLVGMTDKFALDEHKRLFDPQERFLAL